VVPPLLSTESAEVIESVGLHLEILASDGFGRTLIFWLMRIIEIIRIFSQVYLSYRAIPEKRSFDLANSPSFPSP